MAKAASKTAMIRARTEPALKAKAEATLKKLGLSPSAAINLFYRQIVEHRGLPFLVKLPNRATRSIVLIRGVLGHGRSFPRDSLSLFQELALPTKSLH